MRRSCEIDVPRNQESLGHLHVLPEARQHSASCEKLRFSGRNCPYLASALSIKSWRHVVSSTSISEQR